MHRTIPANRRTRTLAVVAATGLALAAPALAQNALGSGRALDANLQQGGSRYNPPGRNSNIAEEVRFRNAIVTGNAPGGLSFRGDAGYLSADDFRGNTGANTLYDFQRDSLYSGLATRNIRNIDALRTQMSLATGGAPTFDSGGLFIQRAGSGASVADLGAGRPQVSIDPFSTRIGSLRSTASFIGAGAVEPQYFGTTQDQNGQSYAIGSSPLRGVIAQPLLVNPEGPQAGLPQLPGAPTLPSAATAQPTAQASQTAPQPGQGLTFNPTDLARADDEAAAPRPGQVNQTPTSNRVTEAMTPERLEANALTGRLAPRSAYDQIISEYTGPSIESMTQPGLPTPPAPATTPDNAPTTPAGTPGAFEPVSSRAFLDRIEDLRREILSLPPRTPTPETEGAKPVDVIDKETGEVIEPRRPSESARTVRQRAAETFGDANAPQLDSLVARGADTTLFNRYLREGEGFIKERRWFDAEEAFTRALSRREGDPIASAGRITAQLGAGMYLSASVNIRALFSAHPEMAAVRFRQELFLTGERLEQVRLYLRDESIKERGFARDAAVLLAYIGYQNGDAREVQNAFDAYDHHMTIFNAESDPLVEMLKGVWLDAPQRRDASR